MNRFLRPALVAAALVLIGAVSAPLAQAQQQPPTMTVDPTTLTFGTTFTVSGTGCFRTGTTDASGLNVAVLGRSLHEATPDDPQGEILGIADVEADGTWTLTVTIPDRSPAFDPQADFSRNIRGLCGVFDPAETIFEYPQVPVQFDVPAAPTTTTTSTSVAAAPAPAPAPAAPVSGTATFTG